MAATNHVNVYLLPPTDAIKLWPELEGFVVDALNRDPFGSVTLADVAQQIESGYARVMISVEGEQILAATVIQLYKNKDDERICHVLTNAGVDSHKWLPALIDELQHVGQVEQCAAVTMSGRPGWTRKLRAFGFKTEHVQMRMPINEQQQGQQPEPKQLAVVR